MECGRGKLRLRDFLRNWEYEKWAKGFAWLWISGFGEYLSGGAGHLSGG
jgi:hypothetical protein